MVEAREHHPREAAQLLAWYRQLYDVEDQARGRSADEILALRREQSAPIMANMRAWLDGDAARLVLPKSRLGEAIRYLNNQWNALTVFLEDGRVPIDNNETEQLMKQVATGRKNWLFIGSVEAGYRAAILLTIVSTAHRHHLDVWLYVKDVLDQLLRGEPDLASSAPTAGRWHIPRRSASIAWQKPATAPTRKPPGEPVAARRSKNAPAGNSALSPQRRAPARLPLSNDSGLSVVVLTQIPLDIGHMAWETGTDLNLERGHPCTSKSTATPKGSSRPVSLRAGSNRPKKSSPQWPERGRRRPRFLSIPCRV